MFRIELLDHREPTVAQRIHTVLALAHAQEARLVRSDQDATPARSVGEIQACDEHFLGAVAGDRLIGSVSVGADDEPDQINVASLVVDPEYQRRGVAHALMLEALRRGQSAPFSVVTSEANAPALALYASLGFVQYRRGTSGSSLVNVVKLRRAGTSLPIEATGSCHPVCSARR
jgi:ribosomal protein S18 acetylase RimI-like enzyme